MNKLCRAILVALCSSGLVFLAAPVLALSAGASCEEPGSSGYRSGLFGTLRPRHTRAARQARGWSPPTPTSPGIHDSRIADGPGQNRPAQYPDQASRHLRSRRLAMERPARRGWARPRPERRFHLDPWARRWMPPARPYFPPSSAGMFEGPYAPGLIPRPPWAPAYQPATGQQEPTSTAGSEPASVAPAAEPGGAPPAAPPLAVPDETGRAEVPPPVPANVAAPTAPGGSTAPAGSPSAAGEAGSAGGEAAQPATENTDGDGDGVADSRDFCRGTSPARPVDAFGCTDMETIVLRGVDFQNDSARLADESRAILDNVATTLIAHPEIHVEIAGHTDDSGDTGHDADLSARRAIMVMKYLADAGVSTDNMIARGYGAERPITPDDTPQGRAANRRIELSPLD